MTLLSYFKKHRNGRRGILKWSGVGGGILNKGFEYSGTMEIVEVDKMGDMSKIEIIKAYGGNESMIRRKIDPSIATTRVPLRGQALPGACRSWSS